MIAVVGTHRLDAGRDARLGGGRAGRLYGDAAVGGHGRQRSHHLLGFAVGLDVASRPADILQVPEPPRFLSISPRLAALWRAVTKVSFGFSVLTASGATYAT